MAEIPGKVMREVRRVCLALPEAEERETWDHPTFRVRDKMFATIGASEDEDGGVRTTMSMKAAPGEQEILLAVGHPFFYPRYVGSKGWIGVEIDDDTDWEEVAELVEESYRAIAPKTLARQLDA